MNWEAHYKINRDSFDGKAKHRKPTQYNVYTDGSKLDGKSGAGVVVFKGQREVQADSYRLPDGSTVFQAEVVAVAKAAESLKQQNDGSMRYVKIFIDSQATIQAMGNPRVTSKAVSQAITNLNALAEEVPSITLVWIPAHKGYHGNERADELAKAGSKETDPKKRIKIGRPQATVRSDIRSNLRKEWQKEWEGLKMANHSKSFYSGPCSNKARYVIKLARLELGRFVRIISGHNNLNFFQAKLGLTNAKECRFCGEYDETITHFIGVCPRLIDAQRDVLLNRVPTPDMTWSVRELLDFSYMPGINEAFEGVQMEDQQVEESYDEVTLGASWPGEHA